MQIKEFFTKNLLIKILAIIGAIFLWTYVINEGYRVDFLDTEIPIEAFNISEDLALAQDLSHVTLKVRVPTNTSTKSLLKDTKAFIDLKGLRPGSYEKEIKVSFEDPSISLLELEPQKINITLENLESIEKEIEVEMIGEVDQNYQTDDAILSIEKSEIKGASSSLEKIETLIAPIGVTNEMSEIKKIVELEARDINNEKVTGITIHPKSVEITIPVHTKEELKTVGVKANISGNPATGYYISRTSINPATISIKGETETVSNVSYLNTKAIDVTGFDKNSDIDISLELPEGIELSDTQSVTVTIELEGQTTARTIDSNIDFINLDSDLELNSYDPNNISVLVEGSTPIIDNLTSGGVITTIDLAGKGAGSFLLPIDPSMIRLPDSVTLKSIETKNLKITIKK